MAEVKLFDIDLGSTIVSIERLRAELKLTKKEFESAEVGSAAYDKFGSTVKVLSSEIKRLTDQTKANTNALGGINTAAKFGEKSYGALKQSITNTKNELLKLDVGSDQFIKTQKDLVALEQKRIAIEKQIPSLFQERIKGAIDESNTLKGLKDQIKQYTAAVIAGEKGAAEKLAELKDKLGDVQDATKSFAGSGVERLNSSMQLLTESIGNFDGDKFKTALTGIGGAMKAIPIFLILEGIKLLIENFDKIFEFFQQFTSEAQEVKKLELAFDKLKLSVEKQKTALEGSIQVQEAQIELMRAQGKSSAEIVASEDNLFQSKKKLLIVTGIELKQSAILQAAKLKQVALNDSLYEGSLRLAAQIAKATGQDKEIDLIDKELKKNKKERSKEAADQLATDLKAISQINTDLQVLELQQQTKVVETTKANNQKRRENDRQLKQAQIDNIEDVYQRQLAQIQFDEDTAIQDVKLNKSSAKLKKEIFEKARQENVQAAKEEKLRLQEIENKFEQFQIDLIRNGFERSKKQLELDEKSAIQQAEASIKNVVELEETKQAIRTKYAEENRKLAYDYVVKDLEAEAQLNILKAESFEEQFQARREQLKLQQEQELADLTLTEQQKLLIKEDFAKKDEALELERLKQKQAVRDSEIAITKDAANVLINIGQLLTNNESELANLGRIAALINIAANTATAISGLVATSFSPTQPDNLVNPLAPYLKIAAGVAAISSNAVQAKQILNSFEEGGYTGDGNPKEVSTNLGSKPYTYHKSEYVIPARVLATPTGSMLASKAESMRLGMINPMPYIGGMFDGGFTARSAGSDATNSIANNKMLQDFILKMPKPVVRVSEINKVQQQGQQAIDVSSI